MILFEGEYLNWKKYKGKEISYSYNYNISLDYEKSFELDFETKNVI